jgi:hypothetical protein
VPSDTGYVAEYDRPRFFRELRDFAAAMREFVRRLPQLEREYADEFPRLASKKFWREVYGLPATPDAAADRALARSAPVNGTAGLVTPVSAVAAPAAPAVYVGPEPSAGPLEESPEPASSALRVSAAR